jgi:redox-sensitive bicupin YhaK (pirin superfamily)
VASCCPTAIVSGSRSIAQTSRIQEGATIKVIAGTASGVTGPVRDVITSPAYLDVSLPAGTSFTHRTPRGHTVLVYVIGGKGGFCQQQDPYSDEAVGGNYFDMQRDRLIGNGHLVVFGDGDLVAVTAETEGVRLLLIAGKPIGEPIAWYGPIVMNTQEELHVAFEELERGTCIKDRGSEG